MSLAYKTEQPEDMREWCRRPGRTDQDGNPIYVTEQHSKEACDVNSIIQHYKAGELIGHISRIEGRYGDVSAMDYKTALDLVTGAMSLFEELPSKIRNRFDNDPAKLLGFMEDPANRSEAIELGLINKDWTIDTDGLGEHIQEGGNVNKPDPEQPTP